MKNYNDLLPDFDEILEKLDEIKRLEYKRVMLKLDIDKKVSDIYKTVNVDEQYFINGKSPSVSFVERTYEKTGFNGELTTLRKELAEVETLLDYEKAKLDTLNRMTDVWRTMSANERRSVT